MAYLVKCPLCGRSVSNECRSCPGCGHNVANEIFEKEYRKKQEEYEKWGAVESTNQCYDCSYRTDENYKNTYGSIGTRCRYWKKSTYGGRICCSSYYKARWSIEAEWEQRRKYEEESKQDPDPYNAMEF